MPRLTITQSQSRAMVASSLARRLPVREGRPVLPATEVQILHGYRSGTAASLARSRDLPWHFRLRARGNHRILAHSENYSSKRKMADSAALVLGDLFQLDELTRVNVAAYLAGDMAPSGTTL